MDRKIDTTLEERLSDIDEFIQSELGFPPVSHNSESVTVEELYSISSLFREAGDELLENETNCVPKRACEVEVEVQIVGLKDVYDKKTKKTKEGFEYRLDDAEVTVIVQASDEISSIRAYTQRCHEAAMRTHDTIGPVELDVKVVQSEARFRVVVVDLGSVYKTQGGDPVYWLEKAEVIERNKWEMMIEMEFGSDLKGTVKSEPFRVTTKASYKIKGKGDLPSCGNVQRLFRKFGWPSDSRDVPDRPFSGIKQEFSNEAACSLSGELDAFSFTKEDDNTSGHFPADSFETDLESGCEPLAGRKILFRDHTTLDRKMVSKYYNSKSSIHYIVEQPEDPGLLKLVGKRCMVGSSRRKANGHKSAEEDFWWACGHCFFERRKKSTIKAHVSQRVCQKSIENKLSKRKLTSRQHSESDLVEPHFLGYTWKDSLSV
ncbi:unnamed protein product [Pocillopora meandrina]|uniref:Uncharacterized protein n=1 Tax=Pocillopora meandrina TaxID=46732 RepID=A0AAU9VME7_9CNID|nr:unnamed protein product [Pocillopora meandrina]